MATVRQLLEPGVIALRDAGVASPRLDAELLLAAATGTDRTGLLAHPEAAVGAGPESAFTAFLARRRAGEPVAYIRGFKEFHGLLLGADPRALVPRPETELLVELVLARITGRLSSAPRPAGSPPLRVWDVGTGSGAIAVALAVALRRRRYEGAVAFVASDVSSAALGLALENAVAHGVADRIELVAADLLAPPEAGGAIDIVAANLPYLTTAELAAGPPELAFEPRQALDGGRDGLDVIRRLLVGLPARLASRGTAFLEIGASQGGAVRQAMADLPGEWRLTLHRDLADRDRVAEVERGALTAGGERVP